MSVKAILLSAMVPFTAVIASAQNTDTTTSIVNPHISDNSCDFKADGLRPLKKMPGAPTPFYTYFWEFGDGKLSFEKEPVHIYADTGTYQVRLFATNNYDDGKPPPTRPRPVRIRSKTLYAANKTSPSFFRQGGAIEMKVNRMPKPDEDMVVIIGYRNLINKPAVNGSLALFYNEKLFKKNNFDLTDERAYHQETRTTPESLLAGEEPGLDGRNAAGEARDGGIWDRVGWSQADAGEGMGWTRTMAASKFAGLLAAKRQLFRAANTWHFTNLQKGDEQYFFLTLHTTPDMIEDTNAVVTISGMFIPDDPDANIEEYAIDLQIVASHDPNRMMLKNQRLDYRFTGSNRESVYRVIFQNSGTGPARDVSLGVALSPMQDPRSVEILDYSPKCPLCDSIHRSGCLAKVSQKDSVYFVFKNIYVQGILQDGMRDPDSARGFVKYRVRFNDRLKKLPFDSRAGIVFDRQDPVYSNPSRGDFKPGKSLGFMAGYGKHVGEFKTDDAIDKNISIGASLSPYAPYRKYLQAEAFLSYQDYPEDNNTSFTSIDTILNGVQYSGAIVGNRKQKALALDLVPAEIRYNIRDWVGVGAGPLVTVNILTSVSPGQTLYLYDSTGHQMVRSATGNSYTQWFKNPDLAFFGDVQIGKVRDGPVLGMRYLYYLGPSKGRLFFYLAWRL
jgi:hypothetical protein